MGQPCNGLSNSKEKHVTVKSEDLAIKPQLK